MCDILSKDILGLLKKVWLNKEQGLIQSCYQIDWQEHELIPSYGQEYWDMIMQGLLSSQVKLICDCILENRPYGHKY